MYTHVYTHMYVIPQLIHTLISAFFLTISSRGLEPTAVPRLQGLKGRHDSGGFFLISVSFWAIDGLLHTVP